MGPRRKLFDSYREMSEASREIAIFASGQNEFVLPYQNFEVDCVIWNGFGKSFDACTEMLRASLH